jgi:hypothetical protein
MKANALHSANQPVCEYLERRQLLADTNLRVNDPFSDVNDGERIACSREAAGAGIKRHEPGR